MQRRKNRRNESGEGSTSVVECIIKPMETDAEIEGKGYVHYITVREAYEFLLPAEYLERQTLEKCISAAKVHPQNTFVAKDGERVIGFCCYNECQDEGMEGSGEVYALYVLAEYYGNRVGYELMTAAIERLSAYDRIYVWVLKGNERAINFYKKYGFCFDGTQAEIKLGEPRIKLRMVYTR